MKIRTIIKISFKQLLINRTKSFFAIAGLSIGIASVITMVAVGEGARSESLRQLEQAGSNLIVINAAPIKNVLERRQNIGFVTTLQMNDYDSILQNISVKEVVASVEKSMDIKYGNTTTKSLVNGVSNPYFRMKNFAIDQGALFSDEDNETSQRVAVIGSQVCDILFEDVNPIGKTILINKIPFIVTGTLKPKGINADAANLDNQVLIPVKTAQRRVFNVDYLRRIIVEAQSTRELSRVEQEIIPILRQNHHLDALGKGNDFDIENQLASIQAIESSSQSFTWLIVGVAAISIIVGGIGILAVMLLSVKERIGEIGLRISFGAKRRDISRQFMIEATVLGFAGGFVGLFAGSLVSVIVKYFTSWQISFTLTPIVVSFLFSIIIGLISGVIPARRAAKYNPVLALQKE